MPRKSEIEARRRKEALLESCDKKLDSKQQKKMAAEYIKGGITLTDLGAKWGLTKDEVLTLAREGEWTKQKRRYQIESIKRATDKAIDIESEKLFTLMQASEKFDAALFKLVNTENTIFTPQDLQYLARALRDAVCTKRSLYNLPTLEEQARIESQTGRLNIENEKLAMLKEQAKEALEDKTVTVTFEGDLKEYAE